MLGNPGLCTFKHAAPEGKLPIFQKISLPSIPRSLKVALALILWASLVAQRVKHLPAMWETQVQSPGWEDPLEKEMATHSSTLVWKIPWTEEPGRLQSMGSQRVGHFTFTLIV